MDLLPKNYRQNYIIYKNELGRPRNYFYNICPSRVFGIPTGQKENKT